MLHEVFFRSIELNAVGGKGGLGIAGGRGDGGRGGAGGGLRMTPASAPGVKAVTNRRPSSTERISNLLFLGVAIKVERVILIPIQNRYQSVHQCRAGCFMNIN